MSDGIETLPHANPRLQATPHSCIGSVDSIYAPNQNSGGIVRAANMSTAGYVADDFEAHSPSRAGMWWGIECHTYPGEVRKAPHNYRLRCWRFAAGLVEEQAREKLSTPQHLNFDSILRGVRVSPADSGNIQYGGVPTTTRHRGSDPIGTLSAL
ncbi:hypothetical protein K469DRAFT_683895 [Zopfia rhizophila CBS 207.26]|uniref:Uncharacterized protein n=1 Tax=Zopfia rhizophila CBS 207.26 TaxID=1314779 RepID=A0A6A6D7T6_9PEZI|nr:hypothetical protein K469DRAFT_683895 [Zopfia rhizophila CBS 207.26]